MKDFVIIVPFYKRHEVTSLCFEHLQKQREKLGFFDVITCGSEGKESKDLAEKYGHGYVEFKNIPVSHKNNFLIQQTKDYKAVIILGSDDFLTDETLLSYQNLNLDTCDVYGFEFCHFYNVATTELYKFQSRGQTIGAGRVYTQKLLQSLDYSLWNGKQNKGLDYLALKSALAHGKEVIIQGDVLDVKHELNITSHSIIESSEKIDISELSKFNIEGLDKLQESNTKQIIMSKEVKSNKRRVKFLKDVYQYKKGTVIEVSPQLARQGVNAGDWEFTTDAVKKAK
jgi:hypothetical protein